METGVVVIGLLLLFLYTEGGNKAAQASSATAGQKAVSGGGTLLVEEQAPAPSSTRSTLASVGTQLKNLVLQAAGTSLPQAAGAATKTAGQVASTLPDAVEESSFAGSDLESVSVPHIGNTGGTEGLTGVSAPADEGLVGAGAKPVQSAGGAAEDAGSDISEVNPIVGTFVSDVLTAGKFRGATTQQQSQILGSATFQALASGASAIPFVGPAISAAVKALGGTGTGAQAIAAVGESEENVYTAQKSVLAGKISAAVSQLGNALTGGGSDQASRKQTFYASIDSLIAQLEQGGTLTAANVASFQQAMAYGYNKTTSGFTLSSLTLTAGTNPFLGGFAAQSAAAAAKVQAAQTAAQAQSTINGLLASGAAGSVTDPSDPTGNTVVEVSGGKVTASYQRVTDPTSDAWQAGGFSPQALAQYEADQAEVQASTLLAKPTVVDTDPSSDPTDPEPALETNWATTAKGW
jgi:hypothetical protein